MALLLAMVSVLGGSAADDQRTLVLQGIRQVVGHRIQGLRGLRSAPSGASVVQKASERGGSSASLSCELPFGWGQRSDVGLAPAILVVTDETRSSATGLSPASLALGVHDARAPPSNTVRV